eukprot:GHVS01059519.1.p1 GENE.GHVS01059519.1~~GHVS01059519.1.p1  ORF type:complete len:215 (+),score=24.55 GHVS01059519.1:37-681(+)
MFGGGGGGTQLVAQTEDCKVLATHLMHSLVGLGGALLATSMYQLFITTKLSIGPWPFINCLLLGVAYWSVKDPWGYKPNWMVNFVMLSTFGTIVSVVYFLQCALVKDFIIAVLLLAVFLLSVVTTNLSWRTYKEMTRCGPATPPLADSVLPTYTSRPLSAAGGSAAAGTGQQNNTSGASGLAVPNPWAPSAGGSTVTTGFIPFQGQGNKLGSIT